jgi:predicted negative regulator of RcsB-dependent stress response
MLLAALYNQSRVDRREKRLDKSAALMREMISRWPNDTAVRFLWVESLLLDAKDYPAALRAADSISVADTDARWRPRKANLKADAFLAMNNRDSARAVLAQASTALPANARIKARLDSLK